MFPGTISTLLCIREITRLSSFLSGHVEIVKWLIANGVNMEARDESDRTALDLAVRNEQDEVIDYLQSFARNDDAENG